MNTGRLEQLVEKVRSIEDEAARDAALQLVQAVMDLHGAGLDRMMDLIAASESQGLLFDEFAKDTAVSAILLLHNLHPLELETRVRRAVEHPSLALRGGEVRILSVKDGLVRARVSGGPAFEARVRDAILEAAPDAGDIVIESAGLPVPAAFVPVEQLLAR